MMDASDLDAIIENLERILTDATQGNREMLTWGSPQAEALWSNLEAMGYPSLCVPKRLGGLGASLADIARVAHLAGRFTLPLPLADTLLANALIAQSGMEPPPGKTGLIDPGNPTGLLAYGAQIDGAISMKDGYLSYHDLAPSKLTPADKNEDGAAKLNSDLSEPEISGSVPTWLTSQSFRALAAMMRAAQMAGAMQAVLEITLEYTQQREQFGRALAKFQAIQHHLSDIACETAASIAAMELASDALRADTMLGPDTANELAIAKIRCAQAAARVAAASHQAHGAMGFTYEYALGQYTRRLWQWQDEFGSGDEHAIALGHRILADGDPTLWPHVSRNI